MQSLSLSKLQTQADVAVAQSQLLLTAAKARNVTHPCEFTYIYSLNVVIVIHGSLNAFRFVHKN